MTCDNAVQDFDVVIVGGGPGGTTTGSLLKKYNPSLKVLIVEREKFPREHIGESQLPEISKVLNEMGIWDKVEAAGFPIKIGATYRWGRTPEPWDFEFFPIAKWEDQQRPAKYAGQRLETAFQVDRAIYDDILLRHATSLDCEVREETAVAKVIRTGDHIDALELSSGVTVRGKYYVDSSGNAAVLRRNLEVPVDCPSHLKNIAIWDYWDNAEWAVEIGVGATRIQIMTVGYGWLWFIPLGPTRTSLGLVCPAEYYKNSGKTPEQLYTEAIAGEERIKRLTAEATRTGTVRTVNDWSFVAERTVGENWFLVGDAAGFADPILSAGLTLTQVGGRELACTLLALLAGEHDPEWLKRHYDESLRRRVRQHMRFADFWYAANGQFTDLQEHCRTIATDSGLQMNAKQAWAWLAQGGFTTDFLTHPTLGGLTLAGAKHIAQKFVGEDIPWSVNENNLYRLNLEGASRERVPYYSDGKIIPIDCFVRGNRRLAITGMFELLVKILEQRSDVASILATVESVMTRQLAPANVPTGIRQAMQALEVMVDENWVVGSLDPTLPRLNLATPKNSVFIHPNTDTQGVHPKAAATKV